MKTKKNWFVIVAAMIMSSVMIFASCSSDDDPTLPEVIESEVLDEGMDDTASSKPSINPNGVTTGTQFSYKSWIMVKGQTRAAFENKVEVTLNNAFNNTDTVVKVYDFIVEPPKVEVSNRKRSERKEGFVTVSDSVMVYSVKFAEFSFDYELDYEVAVYNDGVTKRVMPYHQIGAIKDNGYKVKQLDSAIDGEEAYARQQLVHSISVEFNGKHYDLSATVLLYRHLGPANEPYILRSELVSKNVKITDGNLITSTLNIHQVWSDGRVNDNPVVCSFPFYDDGRSHGPSVFTIKSYKNDFKIVNTELVKGNLELSYSDGNYVLVYERTHLLNVNYGYFTLTIPIVYNEAYYDDGVLSCAFPSYDFGKVETMAPQLNFENYGYDENGEYSVYWLTQNAVAKLGEISSVFSRSVQIVAYK